MSGDMSNNDRAIKRSAEQEPTYVPRPSAPRLEGTEKELMVAKVSKEMNVPMNWSHVHIVNYPAFDERWDHMLVNFYYEQDEDPTTFIKAYRAYTDGTIEAT